MFMPVRAYTPAGTLREALAYPHQHTKFDPADMAKALADVGLAHLQSKLDVEERWDRQLTDDERQTLAFARVILQKPSWIVLNDALDILNPTSRMYRFTTSRIFHRPIRFASRYDSARCAACNAGNSLVVISRSSLAIRAWFRFHSP